MMNTNAMLINGFEKENETKEECIQKVMIMYLQSPTMLIFE